VEKPLQRMGIGIDALPEKIRNSHSLTGNELGMLGNLEKLPEEIEIKATGQSPELHKLLETSSDINTGLYEIAKDYLADGKPYEALKVLMLLQL
jgi:hypothetical protein